MLRLLYISGVFATACWLLVLLYRRFVAARSVKGMVDTAERAANIQALEKAWTVNQELDEQP